MTNQQLARALSESRSNTHYHVSQLRDAGLIEEDVDFTRKSAAEVYYRPRVHPINIHDTDELSPELVELVSSTFIHAQTILGEVLRDSDDPIEYLRIVSERVHLDQNDRDTLDRLLSEITRLLSGAGMPRHENDVSCTPSSTMSAERGAKSISFTLVVHELPLQEF